jgi:hypothetical protein
MKTSTFNATYSSYTISKAALLAGTGFEAYTQFSAMFGQGIGLVPTIFFTGLVCLLFDRTAFVFLEDFAAHITKQSPLPKIAAALSLIVGLLAYAGTVGFSLMAVPIIADATTADKSDTYKDMQTTNQSAIDAQNAKITAIDSEISRLSAKVDEYTAQAQTARQREINAIGGEFAKLWQSGNTWVKSAPQYKRQRARIEQAQAEANARLKDAETQLSAATETKRQLLTTTDANSAAIIQAATISVNTWQQRRTNIRAVTLYLTTGAAIVSILSLSILAAYKRIPQSRDLSSAIGDTYDGLFKLTTEAIHSLNAIFRLIPERAQEQRAETSIPFEVIVPRSEPAYRPDKDEIRKLRKKISEYRRRQEKGELGEIGLDSLQRMEAALNQSKAN